MARLLAAITNPADRLLVQFAAETGLRVSEIEALRWTDVEGGRVHVHRRYRKGRFDAPKSMASRRSVPLSPSMSRRLWTLRKHATYRVDDDLVWASTAGTPRGYENLYSRILKPASKRANLPWVGWHTLRRTCATLLVTEHGFLPNQVQAWLGHEDATIGLNLYSRLTSGDLPTVDWDETVGHEWVTPTTAHAADA